MVQESGHGTQKIAQKTTHGIASGREEERDARGITKRERQVFGVAVRIDLVGSFEGDLGLPLSEMGIRRFRFRPRRFCSFSLCV